MIYFFKTKKFKKKKLPGYEETKKLLSFLIK